MDRYRLTNRTCSKTSPGYTAIIIGIKCGGSAVGRRHDLWFRPDTGLETGGWSRLSYCSGLVEQELVTSTLGAGSGVSYAQKEERVCRKGAGVEWSEERCTTKRVWGLHLQHLSQ